MDMSDLKQVGEFTHYLKNRRLIRSVKNPLDKCTIVSILPKEINETKYTIDPGRFHLEPGSYEKPTTLTIGGSSWWKDVDVQQPLLEIPNSSIQVAESIVNDYCNGMLGCDMSGAMPGLFFVLGAVSGVEIKLKYREKLDEVNAKQNKWYEILVRLADSLWARTNGNPLVIADEMKMAANALNLKEKSWLKDQQMSLLAQCKACGGLRNPAFPVCPVCKAIDIEHPMAKELKFAV